MSRPAAGWLALATAPVWLFPVGWWLAYSPVRPVSSLGHVLIYSELFGVLGLLLAAGVFVTRPVMLAIRRHRRTAARQLLVAAVFTASFFGGLKLRMVVWRAEVAAVADRGQPLVDAITAFTADDGRPPRSLGELVPGHIAAIPPTGIGRWPEFRYVVGKPADYDGNEWVLVVTPPCNTSFDQFFYFPRQNYPTHGYGGGIERVGTWGYVHE